MHGSLTSGQITQAPQLGHDTAAVASPAAATASPLGHAACALVVALYPHIASCPHPPAVRGMRRAGMP